MGTGMGTGMGPPLSPRAPIDSSTHRHISCQQKGHLFYENSIEWNKKWNSLVIIFNNGIISSVYMNAKHNVVNVYHDRYLINKLLSEHIVNVILNDNYLLISYTESKLTLVSITQPIDAKRRTKLKLTAVNTKISSLDLESGTTRRAERNLVVNESGDLLIVWWKAGTNCVAPWSPPGANFKDLANIFVYSLTNSTFRLISMACISGHIFKILMMRWDASQVILLQQSTHSVYLLNYCVFQIDESIECLQQIYSIRIPLMRACVKAEVSAALDKIILLLDDNSIALFNIQNKTLYSMHSSVSAFDVTCNPLDAIFTVADQLSRISVYDYAFNTLDINYEDLINERIVRLNSIKFITKSTLCLYSTEEEMPNITLIVLPVVMDNKALVNYYLRSGQCDEAIACLRCVDWNCYSESAFFCLNYIFNHIIKERLNPKRESQLETTLAIFLTPNVAISEDIVKQYKLEIHFLAKRFFYHLVRYNCLDKAFLLGLDLNSKYLFSLLHRIALQRNNNRIATAAHQRTQSYDNIDYKMKTLQTAFMLQL
ncbi:unnamed protein product [Medioppia subpectinata]|uniref:Mic1 domain-containing protein n=1 Tax=Medioppia subpectinata TaxID=1979941 RepID=A0A7R9Q712_9ACAR|nr:unnamed protein product [Medioppia subpectinata]CAG2114309.1 unnamed protein product [Medioppia subpectinata]